jgi:hypothetical protein
MLSFPFYARQGSGSDAGVLLPATGCNARDRISANSRANVTDRRARVQGRCTATGTATRFERGRIETYARGRHGSLTCRTRRQRTVVNPAKVPGGLGVAADSSRGWVHSLQVPRTARLQGASMSGLTD